jgi:hypothetical protein
MKSHDYDPQRIEEYLADVLNYYKTSKDPSFSKWPKENINWAPFTLNENKFYPIVEQWFSEKGINILRHNGKKRYLSTFILAAEFPPTLGFQEHIKKMVQRRGWHSLYKNPEFHLKDYIDSVNTENLTVAEKQFLKKDSDGDGFTAFLELIKILSTIRFLLGKFKTLDEICVKVASEHEYDIDLIQRIVTTYKSVLIPEQADGTQLPSPKFEYHLQKIPGGVSLLIVHNLNLPVQIPLPSSINLNRFSLASMTVLSSGETLPILQTMDAVSLETDDSRITADFGLSRTTFPLRKRNLGLKDVNFYLTARNKYNELTTINLGGIKRHDDFLVFDESGREVINSHHSFKMGQPLSFVPLSVEIGEAFQKSGYFICEPYVDMPVFTLSGEPEEVVIGDITLRFCEIPFAIETREQSPWELAFKEKGSVAAYFFSSNFSYTLKGIFDGTPLPTIELVRIIRINGKKELLPISHVFNDGIITSKNPIPEPGLYRLTVKFNSKSIQRKYVHLLPIRSVRLIHEKRLQLRLYKKPQEFILQDEHICSSESLDDKIELEFDDYGTYQIEALYTYLTNASPGADGKIRTLVKFTFLSQQEVVGHFSRIITGTSVKGLSLKKDLLPGSYFEFRRSALRESAASYVVVAYMEGNFGKGIFPKVKRYAVRGEDTYNLSDIERFVSKHAYSRLLLVVLYKDEELFRAEFNDDLGDIVALDQEWNRGYYHRLAIVPICTPELKYVDNLELIPAKSIVYGAVENSDGTTQIVTHGHYYDIGPREGSYPLQQLLYMLGDDVHVTQEEKLTSLISVLSDPKQAYEFVRWFTKASRWDYPHDIIPFVRLIQDFPIIAVWADIARIPEDPNTPIPKILKEAQFLLATDEYSIPNVRNLMAYPMFLPERVSLKDFRLLEEKGLMIGLDTDLSKVSFFYMQQFSGGGKPVLSWISLFWLKHIASRCNQTNTVKEFWNRFRKVLSPLIDNLYEDNQETIATYQNDRMRPQDIWALFSQEQLHYVNPVQSNIPTLPSFFEVVTKDSFSSGLSILFSSSPLIMAKPYLEGFQESSKWKCIIFLSLYAVCWQIEKTPILERLNDLYHLSESEYAYLIQWIGTNTETSYIYDAYYEYWMQLFWEEDDV